MELFINKMRRLKGIRKMVVIEEAWKAIASANMADYIRYLYKTVRKFYGEAVVVTQEVEDIISSPIVKESIINNSDCKILLDQRKYLNKFDQIQTLLGLSATPPKRARRWRCSAWRRSSAATSSWPSSGWRRKRNARKG